MAEGDLASALRRLMERGWRSGDPTRRDMAGLQDLMDRLGRRREELRERFELGDVLGDVRRELDEIVAQERAGVERRLEPRRRRPRAGRRRVDALRRSTAEARPPTPTSRSCCATWLRSGSISWTPCRTTSASGSASCASTTSWSPMPATRFDELVERLGKQVLDQYVGGMSDAIRSITPEDLAANREMVRDLNQLIRERIGGGDPDVREFLAKHGRFFPGAQNLDDIIDQLAQRMAAMQSLLRSMTAGTARRARVDDGGAPARRPAALDLAQLASKLDQLMPGGLGDRVPVRAATSRSASMGRSSRSAGSRRWNGWRTRSTDVERPGDLAEIDRDQVRDLLGDDAVRDLDALDDLARRLEEAGYLTRDGERLELTPRGSRRIGQKVLDDLFARLRARRIRRPPARSRRGEAGSARRPPSRTSSATRSTSICGGRSRTRSRARRTRRSAVAREGVAA